MKYFNTVVCLTVSFLFSLLPSSGGAQTLIEAMTEHLQCYPVELVSLEKQRPSITNQEVCLATIYHEMGALPLWVTESGPSPKARVLLSFLQKANEEGLDPGYYEAARLKELMDNGTVESLAVFDTLLTYNVVKYIHDISYGQLKPLMVDPELFAEAGESSFDPVATIDLLVKTEDVGRYLDSLLLPMNTTRG